jgi:DNA-binding transcriptional ArsR family regulator
MIWSKLPSQWIRDGILRAFSAAGGRPTSGVHAAALKLQMALAMYASFRALPADDTAGYARLSFSELEQLYDISRRSVARGLTVLEQHGLITTHAIGNAHRYLLSQFQLAGWAKLPRAHLLEENRFRGLGLRGAASLPALKLYLALVTFRPNPVRHVLLSYDKIEHYTGIPRPRIRHAIDVLINHDWISIAAHAVDPIADGIYDHRKPTNVYILRGDFWGRPQQTYARAAVSVETPR